ncbi:DUF2516 family protein [Actinoplanes regularis]|uniref:DUF2516 family protein n=1 Tax=Actinoplanes regularis TaxID=52697 RepID=A0A239GAG9_9ACTN|nr:DUF2516 family protein [Actinoplanes regularis]GIE90376.1 hypothetical protein Are01nite_68560 [Actinoplanes regularis]GLW33913.1 hypothetical protein Areg01_68510 [Actinoplanes regularis]SNS66071.1 Protein of unknown function [Actinoplanes regularis]
MASSAPIFYDDVQRYIEFAILLFALVIETVAFVHCLIQRGAAFQALGTLPKGAWAAIIGVCLVMTWAGRDALGIFGLIGIAASLIYLLDVRPGLKDIADGKGFW